jgi:formylglycine-generating enzyme required for sulfatase activity/DNA-binding beta-propeller fold protein YncE
MMIQRIAVLFIISVAIVTGCVEKDAALVTPTPVLTSTPNYTPLPTATSIEELKKNFTNSIGMEFVLIPAGEFDMGSPLSEKYRGFHEGPVHHVKIAYDFYMGKYEVTQKQWREIMGNSPSFFKGDDLPVEQVSWYDVQEFIKKLNEKEGTDKYRLPSEAEWEYAARAGTTTIYSFGDNVSELGDYAWYRRNSNGTTHPVGQKNPNPWGLYDMHGNVWEWMQDSWHATYDGAPTDGSAWESNDAPLKVRRSGVWRQDAGEIRSAMRLDDAPYGRFPGLGFRLVRNIITPLKNASATVTAPTERQDVLSMRFNLQNYTAQHLWQPILPSPMSIVVGPDGTIYVLKLDNTVAIVDPVSGAVTQKTEFDAVAQQVMRGFSNSDGTDRAVSPDGMTYFADWTKGVIIRDEGNGTKKTIVDGLSINDPIYLDFGPDGMLYFTDRCTFRQVNAAGGPIKTYDFMRNVNSEVLCIKDFALESTGDVVFVSHTSSNIIRASLQKEKLQVVVPGTLNSPAMAISPEGKIFVGQTAEYPIEPSRVVRLEDDGKTSVVAEVPGFLYAIAFVPDGSLYGTSFVFNHDRNFAEFWLYRVLNNGTVQMIMHRSSINQQIYKLHTLSVNPLTGDLVGFDDVSKRAVRFSPDGKQESVFGPILPYPVWSGRAVVDSEGATWLLVIAEQGQLRGPSVNRELYRISPNGETKLIAKLPYLRGCCTQEAMTVGPDNVAYIILSPEFDLIRVHKDGSIEKLANNLPIDPLGIAVDRTGGIVFSSSDGIFLLKPKE